MSTVETVCLTAEEFWEWCARPENAGARAELDRGEVVALPPPGERRGVLCGWIVHLLGDYVFQRGYGAVSSNDTGLVVEREPDSVRGPDVMLFDEDRPLENLSTRHSTRVPRLVVEVLSPTDRVNAVNRRVGQYLRLGVPLVWLVDPETRTVAVYRPGEIQRVLDDTEEVSGEGVLPGLRLPIARLFTLPLPQAASPEHD